MVLYSCMLLDGLKAGGNEFVSVGQTWNDAVILSLIPSKIYGINCGEFDSAIPGPPDNRWITLIDNPGTSFFWPFCPPF